MLPPLQGNLIAYLTAITLVIGLLTVAWRVAGRPIYQEWLANRTFQAEFRADWHGAEGRPGRPAVPGVMETLEALRADRVSVVERLLNLEVQSEKHSQEIAELRADLTALDDVITRS